MLGGILWTIAYDTIYAIQDIEDDALVGVHSTARLFGPRVGIAVALFQAGAIILFLAAFIAAGVGWLAYIGLPLGAVQLAWQALKDRQRRQPDGAPPLPFQPDIRADRSGRLDRRCAVDCGLSPSVAGDDLVAGDRVRFARCQPVLRRARKRGRRPAK